MDEPLRPGEGILHHTEGVDLSPADIQLSGMEVSLVNAMSRETILRQYLDTLRGQYSHILIDCQPSQGSRSCGNVCKRSKGRSCGKQCLRAEGKLTAFPSSREYLFSIGGAAVFHIFGSYSICIISICSFEMPFFFP